MLVRILEFESDSLNLGNRSLIAEVELWDCSGDQKVAHTEKVGLLPQGMGESRDVQTPAENCS